MTDLVHSAFIANLLKRFETGDNICMAIHNRVGKVVQRSTFRRHRLPMIIVLKCNMLFWQNRAVRLMGAVDVEPRAAPQGAGIAAPRATRTFKATSTSPSCHQD